MQKVLFSNRVPYSEVVEVRSEAVVDGGLLVLEMMGDALDLIRYSNGLMPKFGYIAKFLSEEIEHRQGKRDEAPMWEYEEEQKFCKACGLPLPDVFLPCPACTKKHRVMLRILSYLKPHKKRAAVVVLLMLVSTLIALMPPYFTKILIDDVLKLNEDLAAAQGAAKTAVGQFFRSFENSSTCVDDCRRLSRGSAYPHPYPRYLSWAFGRVVDLPHDSGHP